MMKKNILNAVLILMVASLTIHKTFATDWRKVVDLKGLWEFSVGDDMNWAKLDVNTVNWDKISVPDKWEDYYPAYNGFAWYRKEFDMHGTPKDAKLALLLGKIDDVNEVFINGVKIGETGSFMPNYKSAYDQDRIYYLPEALLRKEKNVIAVRVYDEAGKGGIVSGKKIGIYYDNDLSLLSLDMSGLWKFSVYREKGIYDNDFDDHNWAEIRVPDYWDNQGYEEHDGYAWYRKKFKVPAELNNEDIYLVLGRIDDFDKVYLNGSLIGRTEYLDVYDRTTRNKAYRFYRVYKLPLSKLQAENILVVEVKDEMAYGGIYDGPIGLMTNQNAKIIIERNEDEVWDNPLRAIIRFFDF